MRKKRRTVSKKHQKYYVYKFITPAGKPYYIGKTNNMSRRKKEHLHEIEIGNTLPKYNMARKLLRKGYPLIMKIIATTFNENEAFRLERLYIKKFRKQGITLYNCTAGGPDEKPIRINKPLNKQKTTKKVVRKKPLKKSKALKKKHRKALNKRRR